jgi:hypothetical protein
MECTYLPRKCRAEPIMNFISVFRYDIVSFSASKISEDRSYYQTFGHEPVVGVRRRRPVTEAMIDILAPKIQNTATKRPNTHSEPHTLQPRSPIPNRTYCSAQTTQNQLQRKFYPSLPITREWLLDSQNAHVPCKPPKLQQAGLNEVFDSRPSLILCAGALSLFRKETLSACCQLWEESRRIYDQHRQG